MRDDHLWLKAQSVTIKKTDEIPGGFDVGFDRHISEETKDFLMDFVYWVEDHFQIPVTLWVDFKYNHYLLDANKRVGYKFYWVDFENYPAFSNPDDIPVIELPVRCAREKILVSLIEAISKYFIWLTNNPVKGSEPDPEDVADILQTYLRDRKVAINAK